MTLRNQLFNTMLETKEKLIRYVVQYAFTLTNKVNEDCVAPNTISYTLFKINANALQLINQINEGTITTISALAVACNPMGQAYFEQIVEDEKYADYLNERAKEENWPLPY